MLLVVCSEITALVDAFGRGERCELTILCNLPLGTFPGLLSVLRPKLSSAIGRFIFWAYSACLVPKLSSADIDVCPLGTLTNTLPLEREIG